MTFRFGNCQLDTDARRLQCGGREMHLSPKAFEVLALLVESRPRALSKAEILEHAWPGTFVTDASLARVINEIRVAIGDRAREEGVVRTVHGFGYAFGAEADVGSAPNVLPAQVVCWLFLPGRDIGLVDGEHIIGRDPEAAVWLDSPKVSRHHARLEVDGESAILHDLDSKNGVFVGGERIGTARALHSGDEIRIGPISLIFRVVSPQMSTETEVAPFRPN